MIRLLIIIGSVIAIGGFVNSTLPANGTSSNPMGFNVFGIFKTFNPFQGLDKEVPDVAYGASDSNTSIVGRLIRREDIAPENLKTDFVSILKAIGILAINLTLILFQAVSAVLKALLPFLN